MKISVYIGTSLDGFIARKDGDIEWLVQFANQEAVDTYEEFMGHIDAVVIGRGTFEKAISFPEWPYEKDVVLLSSSVRDIPEIVKGKVEIISKPPSEVVTWLAARGYSRIYIDGGRVIQDFLKADLVDELIISRVPVIIGTGIPLFGFLDRDLQFQHRKTQVNANGLVRSYYSRQLI
jgi:dihydrofolate reductase